MHDVDEYQRLREMITELKEFMDLTQAEIAEAAGWDVSVLSNFMTGRQGAVRYHRGKALEDLYASHAAEIRLRKEAKAKELMASLGAPT